MQIEELDALMAETVTRFNELKVEEGVVKERLAEIDTNLKRLQGKHEAYEKLHQSLISQLSKAQAIENNMSVDPASALPDPFKKKTAQAKEAEHASN